MMPPKRKIRVSPSPEVTEPVPEVLEEEELEEEPELELEEEPEFEELPEPELELSEAEEFQMTTG